jgi:beta-phosphoglucomutase-like phosphatase (HAD superfamily)
MIAPVELVIFDCDGTLVDSERLAVDVVIRIGGEMWYYCGVARKVVTPVAGP